MKAIGRLKKWIVDNKLDKEGDPAPTLTVTFEFPFKVKDAGPLAKLTNGDAVEVEMLKSQLEMNLD